MSGLFIKFTNPIIKKDILSVIQVNDIFADIITWEIVQNLNDLRIDMFRFITLI